MINNKSSPVVYIHNISHEYNLNLFPVHINNNDIVLNTEKNYSENRCLLSQYSLEIKFNKIINNYHNLTSSIDKSDIIYIPIYTFLLAWETHYVYNVSNIVKKLNELKEFIDFYSDFKKIFFVYSDVMWEDKRCFINYFSFKDNVHIVCYENIKSCSTNQIPVPFITHINCVPTEYVIPFHNKKNNLICYCGRYRKEQEYIKNIALINLTKYQEVKNQWITCNNLDMYNEIDNLYFNSTFSLQPHGDKETRRGFYHSILLGCIPVVFENNYDVYQNVFKGYVEIEDICVVIKNNEINNVEEILKNIDENKIHNIIEKYNKIKHILLYHDDNADILYNVFIKMNWC